MIDIKDQVKDRVKHVGIYLGSECDFNCEYCDRDTVTNKHAMSLSDVPDIIAWLKHFNTGTNKTPINYLTFYGGEPLLWVQVIDKIITQTKEEVCPDMKFHIITNGTEIINNRWFFEKWTDSLMVSHSYDFSYQQYTRGPVDIDTNLLLLKECNIHVLELYYTMPIYKPDVFNIDHVTDIVKLFSKHDNIRKLNILPVRFTNKPDKGFVDYINKDFPVPAFFKRLKQFVEALYVYHVPVAIDGATDKGIPVIAEKMLHVLSSDGYVYNDYVFVEYNHEPSRIGKWKDAVELYEFKEPSLDKCKTCPEFAYCNDKYFYYMWADDKQLENSQCQLFNKLIVVMLTKWIFKLHSKRDLIEHIGL